MLWKTVSSHIFHSPMADCEWHCTFFDSSFINHFLWPTACEWHCTFCENQFHDIFSYDQQLVSDIAHFVKSSLMTSFPMTNRKWVTLHILWKAVSWHLFLWPTASECHCTFCEWKFHDIFSYDQQKVSIIAHFVKSSPSLITSIPMTNSKWVTLHILWMEISWHLCLWPVEQFVSDIAHFVNGNFMASFPMTNRMWVTLHILWKAVSSHLFLWPTAGGWHCIFCLITSFPMSDRLWVALHTLSKTVSSHVFPGPTEGELHHKFSDFHS